MICVVCQKRDTDRSQVCAGCTRRIAAHLRDIAELHGQLTGDVDLVPDERGPHWRDVPVRRPGPDGRPVQVREAGPTPGTTRVVTRRVISSQRADPTAPIPAGPLPGANRHGRVSGGAVEAAAPTNLDAIDLALRARPEGISDPHGDQTGHVPVAAVLHTWARDWATLRAQREHAQSLTVHALASWLTDRLDWACRHHPAIDDFAAETARLRSTLRGVLGRIDQPHYHHGVPCPHCESLALYRTNGEAYTTCGVCGKLLSDQELAEWSRELTSEGADL